MGNDEWCVFVSTVRDGGFFLLAVLFYVVVLLLVAGVIESRINRQVYLYVSTHLHSLRYLMLSNGYVLNQNVLRKNGSRKDSLFTVTNLGIWTHAHEYPHMLNTTAGFARKLDSR